MNNQFNGNKPTLKEIIEEYNRAIDEIGINEDKLDFILFLNEVIPESNFDIKKEHLDTLLSSSEDEENPNKRNVFNIMNSIQLGFNYGFIQGIRFMNMNADQNKRCSETLYKQIKEFETRGY